jgi:hypothetical protein
MGADLKNACPWYWSVSSHVQFVVGTVLLQQKDSAKRFINELIRVRKLFREQRLHRALQFELLAVLILRLQAQGVTISRVTAHRFKAIYDEMKKHHRFLTGPDDFPACAILTGQPGTPQGIGDGVEAIYDQLHDHGFSKGNPLQTAANIMYLAPGTPRSVAGRAAGLRDEFRRNGMRITQRDYSEVATLSILQLPAWKVVARVLELRDELAAVRPKIHKALRFDLAVGIAFADFTWGDAGSQVLGATKVLLDVQAMLAAQAALMAAGAAAAAAGAA